MSVGIPEIDEDEKQFISLVDAFNRSIVDRMDISEVKARLKTILDETERHFPDEERLLKKLRYPDVGEHVISHMQLTKLIHNVKARSENFSTEYQWIEAGLMIKEAIIDHILKEDHKYAEYFRTSRST